MTNCESVKGTWFKNEASKNKCNKLKDCVWNKYISGYYCEPKIGKMSFTDPFKYLGQFDVKTGLEFNDNLFIKDNVLDTDYYHNQNLILWRSLHKENNESNLPRIFDLKKGDITKDNLANYFLAGIQFRFNSKVNEFIINTHEFINILVLCFFSSKEYFDKEELSKNFNLFNRYFINFLPILINPINNTLWDLEIINKIFNFYSDKVWLKTHEEDSKIQYLFNYFNSIKTVTNLKAAWNKKELMSKLGKDSKKKLNHILLFLKNNIPGGKLVFSLGLTQELRNNNKLKWNDWDRKHSDVSSWKQLSIWMSQTLSLLSSLLSLAGGLIGVSSTITFGSFLTLGFMITLLSFASSAMSSIWYLFETYKSYAQNDIFGGTINLLFSINYVYNQESIDKLTSLHFQLGYGKVTQKALTDVSRSSIFLFREIAEIISKTPEKYDLVMQLSDYIYNETGNRITYTSEETTLSTSYLLMLVSAAVNLIFSKKLANEVIETPIEKKIITLLNNSINYKLKVNSNYAFIDNLHKKYPNVFKLSNENSLDLILTNLTWIVEHNFYVNNINVENCPVDFIYKSKKGQKYQNEAKRLGNLKCKEYCKSKNLYHQDFDKCVKRKHLFNCPLGEEYTESKCNSWCNSKNLLGDDLDKCISRTNNILCDASKNRKLCSKTCKSRGLIVGTKVWKLYGDNSKGRINQVKTQYENCVKARRKNPILSSKRANSSRPKSVSSRRSSRRVSANRKSSRYSRKKSLNRRSQ